MKLIVEAGSTKTDSVLIEDNGAIVLKTQTDGINPVTDRSYEDSIIQLSDIYSEKEISNICYYGAGCINDEIINELKLHLLDGIQPNAKIEIHDDLLALGHGLAQGAKGVISIIGTGSNIGFYDGSTVIDKIPSCGYLLGDEGSGFDIGRTLISRWARNQLGASDDKLLQNHAKCSNQNIVAEVYGQDNPRSYIASFGKVLTECSDQLRRNITNEVFEKMIQAMIKPMMELYEYPLHFSGSVAHHFRNELSEKLQEYNILASSIVQSPLEGLINYHKNG